MVNLDVKTLFYLFAISNVFIGLLLLVFNYRNKNQREITNIYLVAKFLQAIFWFSFAYRQEWNIYVTYVLANIFSLLCTFLELYCFYFLYKKVDYKALLVNILIILLASSSLFFFIDSSPSVKVIHMSVLFIPLYMVGGIKLLFDHRGFNAIKIIAVTAMLMGLAFVSKFFIPSSSGLLSPNFVLVVNYIISYLLGFSWTILYFSILNQIAQKEIEKDNQKLKELNATKDKLFSIIAHDLQNPIRAIMKLGEMLAGKLGPLSDADRDETIQAITKSASTTNNLLNNLLQWGRSESGTLTIHPERVSLKKIVGDCEQLLVEIIDQKAIQFENRVAEDVHVVADYNMISTVLRNLIANAVKFTHEGGSVTVSSIIANGKARIEVKDTGVGISKQVLSQLFDTHSQYYTKGTNNEPGTGLGLKLCKEFVDRNGGAIGVESEENKGSTFYFTLPTGN